MPDTALRRAKDRARALVPLTVHRAAQRNRNRLRHAQQRRFDARFSVDTAGLVAVADMDVAGPSQGSGNHYEATRRSLMRRMIRALPIDVGTHTFVDVGSGKGAVLLYASEFPFKAVVGIEHARLLHAVAEENLRRFPASRRACTDLRSVCADALEVDVVEGPLVVFLCNPFEGELMERLVGRLEASLRSAPRSAFILSFNPAVEWVLDRQPWLSRVGKGWNHATYRSEL